MNRMTVQSPIELANIVLAGLVSISACYNVSMSESCTIGVVAAIIYINADRIYQRYKIDDPLKASIIHGVCGYWGVIAVGIFDPTHGILHTGSYQ